MDEDKIVLPETPAELLPENNQTPEPEPVAETPEPESEPEPEVVADESETNKGANQRIRELNQAKKAAEEKAQSLADKLAEMTQSPQIPSFNQNYVPQVQPGQELTIEQYQTDVAKTADAKIEMRLAQERAVNRINNESLDVVRKYPQLDPSSDQFDRELSDTVVEATEAMVRQNPYSASVSKFVERLMKPYHNAISKEVGKQTQTVAKQVSESALRPTSVRQPEKPASEQSLTELEQKLGVVQS